MIFPHIRHFRHAHYRHLRHSDVLGHFLAVTAVSFGTTPTVMHEALKTFGRTSNVRAVTVPKLLKKKPTVTGIAQSTRTLTATAGDWLGKPAPTLTYAWLRDNVAIAGATALTYVVQAADVGHAVSFKVTATNTAGNATATTASMTVAS